MGGKVELTNYKYLSRYAEEMFPNHIRIVKEFFKENKNRYFEDLKLLPAEDRMYYFSKTFYADGGICWFISMSYLYFVIILYGGTKKECAYYGKQKCNL